MAETGQSTNLLVPPPVVHGPALAPLREPLFRTLWMAAVISYTGTWMQNLGAGWLMASLTKSPLMVGLVQAAASVPVFLVILPAGALADMVDRRRLLLTTQWWMVFAAAGLGVLTILGVVTPRVLLLFTFLLGFGAVMNDPAWQAITPEVVSGEHLASAVALNSAGFNVARAVGPALGGLVIAATGSGVAFLLNALSFFGVILFLYRWKRVPHENPFPTSRVLEAIQGGLNYVRRSPPVRAVLVRTGVFSFAASALLALLPLIAHPYGAVGFGVLLGCFGFGALCGAGLRPALCRRLSVNLLVGLATVLFAGAVCMVAYRQVFWLLCVDLFAGGVAWIHILASLNVSAQTSSPAWVRARTLSVYLLVLQGGMAAGSALWGALASHIGIPDALVFSAAGLLLGLVTSRRHQLSAERFDLSSSV